MGIISGTTKSIPVYWLPVLDFQIFINPKFYSEIGNNAEDVDN